MKTLCRVGRRLLLLGLLGLLAPLLALLARPQAALAHPLDVYLQATYITVAPAQIVVELDLTPGVLVAPQVLAQLDTDGDQQITDAEGRAYMDTILRDVVLQVDGQPLSLSITKLDMPPYLTIQSGYGTIRVFTDAVLAEEMTGTHTITYANNYVPTGAAYQVNAFVDQEGAITLGKQNRDDIQRTMTVDYMIGSVVPSTMGTTSSNPDGASAAPSTVTFGVAPLVAALSGTGNQPWWLLLALAALLGGLHALTPGHGKTLAAAYLVGSRGTPRHAVLLGGMTTITHTSSVFVVGLLALLVGRSFAAGALTTALELGAGLLVLVLGARLLWRRGRAAVRGEADPTHGHSHSHDHDHDHDHNHSHDHHHHLPQRVGLGGVIALGISGGLTPCPEALGVMLVAISLGRVWQGLGLIVAFSLGLATTIIALGLVLVLASSRVRNLSLLDRAWVRLLPLGSAALITALGGIMTVRVVLAALGTLA